MIGNMDKFTVDEIQQIWGIWESRYDESFVDYFLDDNINNMGIVLGYWSAKYPELFKYIMNMTGVFLGSIYRIVLLTMAH